MASVKKKEETCGGKPKTEGIFNDSRSKEINTDTLNLSILPCPPEKIQKHMEKETSSKGFHRKKVFTKHPGARNFGKISFHWETFPQDWTFLINIKAGN